MGERTKNTAFQLTVLTTLGVSATKTYSLNEKGSVVVEGYGRAKTFTAETIDIDTRGRWLKKLGPRQHSFVVLGAAPGWKPGQLKRRLSVDRDGEEATLVDVPRAWMPIDIDQIDFDPMADINDGDMFAMELLDRLGLKGVSCVWHLTSGHGFFKRYRARLWVELAEPMTAAQQRDYAKSRWGDEKVDVDGKAKNLVDFSVYQAQQPIYVADPILLDGIESPVTKRVGHIAGDALVRKASNRKADRKPKSAPGDENVALLEEHGLYISRLKPGQHQMECPWEDVHTGAKRDDDTFYFEPHFNGHDIPAFKCHHDSCSGRRWADVLEFMEVENPDPDLDSDDSERAPNWVYIHRIHMFWDARDGALIDKEAYDSTHGGKTRRGTPTERFLAMTRAKKADRLEFRPDRKDLLFTDATGVNVVNSYKDRRVRPTEKGNATDWSDIAAHVDWMVPDRTERGYLLDFVAHCYQNPGQKVMWAPLLFGPPGGGKTLFFDAVARCIGHYSAPSTKDLQKGFDTFVHEKLFVRIEELKCDNQYGLVERLKPLITNTTIDVELKYVNAETLLNFANFAASTNHADALPMEEGERRWCLISTVADLKQIDERRPDMVALNARLSTRSGLAVLAAMLAARDLSGFKHSQKAPETSLKREVVVASMNKHKRAALHMREELSAEPIATTSMVHTTLERHGLGDYEVRRYGLLARELGWLAYGDGGVRNSMHCGGESKEAVWSPISKKADLTAFSDLSVDDRQSYINRRQTRFKAADDDLTGRGDNAPPKSIAEWLKGRRSKR